MVSSIGWEFRDPLFLFAILLAPLVYWLAVRIPSSVTYSSLSLPNAAQRSPRVYLAKLPALLLAFAAFAMAVALAGPRTGDATTRVKRDGIALIMVMDRSGSMNARDFVEDDYSVSRLAALKSVFKQFVLGGEAGNGRPNDLIGIVAFGTYADGVCPLTLDHKNLIAILDQLQVATMRTEAATAVGEGLALAVERLIQQTAESKVIILLTDGVNNAGAIDPLHAADLAAANDIKVYTIAAGITGYAPIPVQLPDGRTKLQRSMVEIDEVTLKEIAARTGGSYFHARDAEGLKAVYKEIDSLEKSEITEIRYMQYREHYALFVLIALTLILVASISGGTLLRRLP
ncbi:MAG: VWA domain-containing protein [Pseudomonadales bacterium]|nr:VWA domain-containing protein [Pseudomonadales bacterium]